MIKHLAIIIFLVFPVTYLHALVDYSEPEFRNSSPQVIQREAPRRASGNRGTSQATFRLGTQYDSLTIKSDGQKDKVGILKFNGQFHTSYDVFMDVRYWMSPSTPLEQLGHQGEESSWHQGNPRVALGFNWIDFGQGPTDGNIDLYGGGYFAASSSSAFGASRNDTFFGVVTSKRFYSFALSLGYEMRMTGTAKKSEELAIGNIQKLHASLAWRTSPDFQLILEGASYNIGAYGGDDRPLFLSESQSFAQVNPSILLRLSHSAGLRLGAIFQTNKVDDLNEMIQARLWDIDGLYGNQIYTALHFGI